MQKMKVVGQTVQLWERTQTDRQTDATKCIISLASRSINKYFGVHESKEKTEIQAFFLVKGYFIYYWP